METTTIIYFVALVAVFIAGVFVGRIVNVNSKVADKRREYEDKLRELRTLPTEWTDEYSHAGFDASFDRFMNFVDTYATNVGHLGGDHKLEKFEWFALRQFFFNLSMGGLCIKVFSVADHPLEDREKANSTIRIDKYITYPGFIDIEKPKLTKEEWERINAGIRRKKLF